MTDQRTPAEKMRDWRAKHPEKRAEEAAYSAKWREAHPELVREQWKRQSKRRSASGPRRRHTTSPCVRCGATERYPSGGCVACIRAADNRRKDADPEKFRKDVQARVKRYLDRMPKEKKRERNQRYNLTRALKMFGMTQEQYDAMDRKQHGRCAICGNRERNGRRLHIDHDHETGMIRALLCGTCNPGLGQFRHSRKLLEAAIVYLDSFAVVAA